MKNIVQENRAHIKSDAAYENESSRRVKKTASKQKDPLRDNLEIHIMLEPKRDEKRSGTSRKCGTLQDMKTRELLPKRQTAAVMRQPSQRTVESATIERVFQRQISDINSTNNEDTVSQCYRWLLPRHSFCRTNSSPSPGQNENKTTSQTRPPSSRVDLVCKKDKSMQTPSTNVVNLQPRSLLMRTPQNSALSVGNPSWAVKSRKDFHNTPKTTSRPANVQENATVSHPNRSVRRSTNLPIIEESNYFNYRTCPACLSDDDTDSSEYSSSEEEDEDGSDTDDGDDEYIGDDAHLGIRDNSAPSDHNDSSGGSDSEDSGDSPTDEPSIGSSIYDEEIMINEQRIKSGFFDSDEEFEFGSGGGAANQLSNESITDSEEYFRGSDFCTNRQQYNSDEEASYPVLYDGFV